MSHLSRFDLAAELQLLSNLVLKIGHGYGSDLERQADQKETLSRRLEQLAAYVEATMPVADGR